MTSQRNSCCQGVRKCHIVRPLDASVAIGCWLNYILNELPAQDDARLGQSGFHQKLCYPERVLCFLDVVAECQSVSNRSSSWSMDKRNAPKIRKAVCKKLNRVATEAESGGDRLPADSIQKTGNLQHLPFRLCLRERTLTARAVLFFERCARVSNPFPEVRGKKSPNLDPVFRGAGPINRKAIASRMKRVTGRSSRFIRENYPRHRDAVMECQHVRYNKQAALANSLRPDCERVSGDSHGISIPGQIKTPDMGCPRTNAGASAGV